MSAFNLAARTRLQSTTIMTGMLAVMAMSAPAYANPEGGNVVGGSASIASSGLTTDINQSSNRAVIEWSSFNIGGSETVNFNQPSSSAIALNRVVGGGGASQINGRLNANGNVIIVNGQGVMFGNGAQVNVGGLIATTADVDTKKFMAGGNIVFDKAGNPNASIENKGSIAIKEGGLAALVGPNVTNEGLIQAKLGKVEMASGDTFSVDLYGDGLISLQASDKLTKQLVKNSGAIEANGGSVIMTAAAAQNAVESVINMDGLIQADSVGTKGGKVVLQAKGEGAKTLVSGTISTKGTDGAKGGKVDVLGTNVALLTGAKIDASGDTGGGKVRVGGDFHGEGDVMAATNTVMQSGTQILANALFDGNGGDVSLWANVNAFFFGDIEAKGGANSGNGGFVETSGKQYLDAFGNVDASATNGIGGEWLLDPYSITIEDALFNISVTGNPNFESNGLAARVRVSSIENNLNNGTSVTITTGDGALGFLGDGSITVKDDITKSNGGNASLTLKAHHNIILENNVDISSSSGMLNVTLNADTDSVGGGAIYLNTNSSIVSNGGNIVFGGSADLLSGAAQGHFAMQSGITLHNASLNAGGGNIILTGHGSTDNGGHGVLIENGSDVRTNGTGTITINGAGGGNLLANDGNHGVYIKDTNTRIRSANGDITINGTGGGVNQSFSDDNYGVSLESGVRVFASGSGNVTLKGIGGGDNQGSNYGLNIAGNNVAIGDAASTGHILLAMDRINQSGNNFTIKTLGRINIETVTAPTTIGVNGGAGTLNLTSAFLNGLSAGKIVIGGANVNGAITANARNWQAPVSFRTNSGNIIINGLQAMGANRFAAISASGGNMIIGTSGGVSSTANGDAIVFASSLGDFTNNNPGSPLSTGVGGRWLIFSTRPEDNSYGSMTSDFYRYSCTYGGSCPSYPASGNGFLYSVSPVVTVTLIPDTASTTYGQAAPSFTYHFSGYNGGDEAADTRTGAAVMSTNYIIGMDAGNYDIIAAPGTLTSSLGYTFQGSTLVQGLTVNKANMYIIPDNQTLVYGAGLNPAAYSVLGLYSADTIGSVALSHNATLSSSGNANVGTWQIIGSAPTGGNFNINNYNIIYNTGILNVTPASLVIKANDVNSVYGSGNNFGGITATGLVGGETVGSASLSTNASLSTGNHWNAGLWDIVASGATGGTFDPANYSITYQKGALNISQRALAITYVTADDKVYDGTDTAYNVILWSDDRASGDTGLSYGYSGTGGVFDNKNVGNNKTVTVTGLFVVGADAANYNLNTLATGTASITPASLTITAGNQIKAYGSGNTITTGFTTSGLVSGETVGNVNLNTNASLSTSGNWNAGLWDIIASGASGGTFDAGNYAINYVNGNLLITPRLLLVDADGVNKTYDATTTAQVTFDDNRISGDVFATNYGSANFINKNVGNNKLIVVTGINISGGDAGNYIVANPFGLALTSANITPAALLVKANDKSMTYGDGNNFSGYTITGLQGGETVGNVTLTTNATTSTSGNWNAGDWDINASNASGGTFNKKNYSITYQSGDLNIDRKWLLIGAIGQDKVYDGTRDATVILTDNRIGGDVFDATYNDASFLTKNVGNNKLITVTGLDISGDDAANYRILNPFRATIGFADITPATLFVTADDKTKVYGDADPALTYSYSGLQGSDTASVFKGHLIRDAGEDVAGGPYAINQGTLKAGTNYMISYVGGNLVITPATLNVVADSHIIKLGDKIPPLTYNVTGFKFTDNAGNVLTGALQPISPVSLPGIYPILQGTLAANSNYVISYTPGLLGIGSPFGGDLGALLEQLSEFSAGGFRAPGTFGTLLSMTNTPGRGAPNFGGNLGNLAPAAGGNPDDLGDLSPAAGGNTIALLECNEQNPCDPLQ